MKAVEIKNLRKSYGNNLAVDNISFNIEEGQFFGFLGPNGSGKSTIIHSISGITKFDKGQIKLFGIDVVKDYRSARKLLGLSPQEFNADTFGRVDHMLDYVAGYYGIRKQERKKRIAELLQKFKLEAHSKKRFIDLSGGLKRRVMLVRALVHDPKLLILDEPTAGVDVELRHELWNYLKELNKAGKTIFLTSHYLEEIEELCDYITIINKGRIVAEGPKTDFLKNGDKLEKKYLEITEGETF